MIQVCKKCYQLLQKEQEVLPFVSLREQPCVFCDGYAEIHLARQDKTGLFFEFIKSNDFLFSITYMEKYPKTNNSSYCYTMCLNDIHRKVVELAEYPQVQGDNLEEVLRVAVKYIAKKRQLK